MTLYSRLRQRSARKVTIRSVHILSFPGYQVADDTAGWWDAQEIWKLASRWSGNAPHESVIHDVSPRYWICDDWVEHMARAKGNLQRANDFVNKWIRPRSYITLTCRDPEGFCQELGRPDWKKRLGGYTWNNSGNVGMSICDLAFNYLSTIPEIIDNLNTLRVNNDFSSIQRMETYEGLGQHFIHALMHLKDVYEPEPKMRDVWLECGDGIYPSKTPKHDKRANGARRTRLLARSDEGPTQCSGANWTTNNADNYAMLANSLFWRDKTHFFSLASKNKSAEDSNISTPPRHMVFPYLAREDEVSFSMESFNKQMSILIGSYLFDNEATDDPPESPKETATPKSPDPDVNKCHGPRDSFWITSRDLAAENVRDFCNQQEKSATYNIGTANELQLHAGRPDDQEKGPQDSPDCVGRFTRAVIDGCDGSDPVNNPWGYKFGSELTTGDGWRYSMHPLFERVNQVSCDVSYHSAYNLFEIRGINLPWNLFGMNGEGLHHELSGCGPVTEWNFKGTPDDCCFDWYARGHLTFGTKYCIGNALVSAGGSGVGGCNAPG